MIQKVSTNQKGTRFKTCETVFDGTSDTVRYVRGGILCRGRCAEAICSLQSHHQANRERLLPLKILFHFDLIIKILLSLFFHKITKVFVVVVVFCVCARNVASAIMLFVTSYGRCQSDHDVDTRFISG